MKGKYVNEGVCIRRTQEIKDGLKEIDEKLDTLRTNDLPHLSTDVAVIKAKLGLNGKKLPEDVQRTRMDKIKDNSWIGVLVLSLVQIIMFLIGMNPGP